MVKKNALKYCFLIDSLLKVAQIVYVRVKEIFFVLFVFEKTKNELISIIRSQNKLMKMTSNHFFILVRNYETKLANVNLN
jgi:hypothetical protein